jgi:hypothetical protein
MDFADRTDALFRRVGMPRVGMPDNGKQSKEQA